MTSVHEDWLCTARKAKRLALIAHVSPDGDTVGATLALRLAFLSLGKAVDVVCDGEPPASMDFLEGCDAFLRPEQAAGPYDTAIAVDVSDRSMMGKSLVLPIITLTIGFIFNLLSFLVIIIQINKKAPLCEEL